MTKAYAAYNQDEGIRQNSSSGGIFPALAETVIQEGGLVYGVRFDGQFRPVYGCAETRDEIRKYQGAKYALPSLGGVYPEIKARLEAGKTILFTGLPCHTAGLLHFLRDTDQSRLICVDVICHGTPEPLAWEAYLSWERSRGGIREICMRDKSRGWNDYRIRITGEDGRQRRSFAADNLYMRGYVQGLYLRKPCYHCLYRRVDRASDLTLGDYWGGNRLHPDLHDDRGLSLVICHTEKGRSLLDTAFSRFPVQYEETDLEWALAQNPALTRQPAWRPEREELLRDLEKGVAFPEAVRPRLTRDYGGRLREKYRRLRRLWKRQKKL